MMWCALVSSLKCENGNACIPVWYSNKLSTSKIHHQSEVPSEPPTLNMIIMTHETKPKVRLTSVLSSALKATVPRSLIITVSTEFHRELLFELKNMEKLCAFPPLAMMIIEMKGKADQSKPKTKFPFIIGSHPSLFLFLFLFVPKICFQFCWSLRGFVSTQISNCPKTK